MDRAAAAVSSEMVPVPVKAQVRAPPSMSMAWAATLRRREVAARAVVWAFRLAERGAARDRAAALGELVPARSGLGRIRRVPVVAVEVVAAADGLGGEDLGMALGAAVAGLALVMAMIARK